jgi:hypothetical protein
VSLLHACWFSFGFKMLTCLTTPLTIHSRYELPSVWGCCICSDGHVTLLVCVCQDMGMWDPLVKHTSCNIQEPIQLQAQCQPSYSVQLTTNEQFNTCPHAQHSKPCSVLYITDKSLFHFWNIPQLLAHSQYGANLLPLPL